MTLSREDILKLIITLSKSQGFYGRLLRDIDEDKTILDKLAEQNFKEDLDLILFLEGGC